MVVGIMSGILYEVQGIDVEDHTHPARGTRRPRRRPLGDIAYRPARAGLDQQLPAIRAAQAR
jgi:hypothetical protein